jgi:hypothetical protein
MNQQDFFKPVAATGGGADRHQHKLVEGDL